MAKRTLLEPKAPRRRWTYPLHEVWNNKSPPERTCAGALILPEQALLKPEPRTLFCLGCQERVVASADDEARARAAAEAEGWTPVAPCALTPGALPEIVRVALMLAVRKRGSGDAKEAWDKAQPEMVRLGLVENGGLTGLGYDMQRRICDPEVPPTLRRDVDPRAMDRYAAAEKARTKKPRAKKPAVPAPPMICKCSHTAGAHTTHDGRCRECACERYKQSNRSPLGGRERRSHRRAVPTLRRGRGKRCARARIRGARAPLQAPSSRDRSMTPLPMTLAALTALVRDAWPGSCDVAGLDRSAEAHEAGGVLSVVEPGIRHPRAAALAIEHLARSLEDAGVEVERRGGVVRALGWAAVELDGVGRRVRDLDPWHPLSEARTARLREERRRRDASVRAGMRNDPKRAWRAF